MSRAEVPDEEIHQDETRCRILGRDLDGWLHVHDTRRNRVVVLDEEGIDYQVALDEVDEDLSDWMEFVKRKRGWIYEQWDGYRLSQAVWGGRDE